MEEEGKGGLVGRWGSGKGREDAAAAPVCAIPPTVRAAINWFVLQLLLLCRRVLGLGAVGGEGSSTTAALARCLCPGTSSPNLGNSRRPLTSARWWGREGGEGGVADTPQHPSDGGSHGSAGTPRGAIGFARRRSRRLRWVELEKVGEEW